MHLRSCLQSPMASISPKKVVQLIAAPAQLGHGVHGIPLVSEAPSSPEQMPGQGARQMGEMPGQMGGGS